MFFFKWNDQNKIDLYKMDLTKVNMIKIDLEAIIEENINIFENELKDYILNKDIF